MNNCGLNGANFATILEGVALVRDFKAIIYKRNEVSSDSISKLQPIFAKRVPFHLQELHIVDCKIGCAQIEELLSLMIEDCSIRSFSLVNVKHSEASFDKLCEYVESPSRLQELNVSW